MTEVSRREFVSGVTASIPLTAAFGCGTNPEWDMAALDAMAVTVLPSAIGADGTTRVVREFVTWADGIQPGAEFNHGYGTGEVRYRGESPRASWQQQLGELAAEAMNRHQTPLAELDEADRSEVVKTSLNDFSGSNLPSPASAPHVAIALMSFFARSAEGVDLAYQASIKKQTCRPLSQTGREPVQLPGSDQ
jgi:hypothetical protein